MKNALSSYLSSYGLSLCCAILGAFTAKWLNLPIPFLLGSLLATAALGLNGFKIQTFSFARQAGLTIIGASLGLYFTPSMWQIIAQNGMYLFLNMLFAIALGLMGFFLVQKWAKVDLATAWFASAVGGASEMANLAAKHHASIDQVVAAHSLRVLLVVTIVPFFYQMMGYQGLDNSSLGLNQHIDYIGLLILLAWAVAMGGVFRWRNWSNPWTFGPLCATAILAGFEWHLSAIPSVLSQIGQVLIGWNLGSKFGRDFFQRAPRLLAVVAFNTVLGLLLTAIVSIVIAQISGMALPTVGLGFAIGGVAEMTITAKVLQLGVPLVTAFHVSRMIAVLASTGYLFQWYMNRKNKPI